MGFCNLKTVVEPITEDFERYLLGSLTDELNALFPLSLATDFVCDRFLEDEVFNEIMNPTALVLVGASHLRNMARLFGALEWQVYDLTTPKWRISEQNVKKKPAEIVSLGQEIELEKATVVLQLYDNSVFLVGGAGGTKSLPT
jgi:riboflavin biosynthesis pyrimidine reductase